MTVEKKAEEEKKATTLEGEKGGQETGNWKNEWEMGKGCKERHISMAELKTKPCIR